ncbi:histone-lysine N-methyltransferase SUVR3 isoform X1 [Selaginella moellendorffii]|uniref:histone-lysine N-methyltransferase SUVR3 isoform X1 n=1 Tax=Selaginella moellendorffii TaxID=88036 RepID=UPI000D1CB09F|nr:histone-lysine N-methyltransferase SUVR3 isoform X1 [Selaginella moellendorffii]|eukprot:XP_024524748.1 histone-lysine N-methyltransferase SUVR3 isoform X1 [Selaginella moellendorffii]
MENVLPWLEPRDVAALALTCRTMAAAARDLTSCRAADAAQGLEGFAIPVVNCVDECRYPYFEYSPVSVLARERRAFAFPRSISEKNAAGFDYGQFGGDGCRCIDCCRGEQEDPGFPSQAPDDLTSAIELLDEDDDSDEALPSKKKRRLSSSSCPCGRTIFGERAYDSNSPRLLSFQNQREEEAPTPDDLPLIYECGPACSCTIQCCHRLSQRGASAELKVVRHPTKGWSLHAAQDIKPGAFICEYAGELLTTKEARKRHQTYDQSPRATSLLVVREHLPKGDACLRFNIDATNVGNIARFINHSCDGGNLLSCLVRSAGCCVPRLAFFTRKEIQSGQELTFSYGVVEPGLESSSRACFCGTSQCRGILPSEKT